ncbi:MAG: glycosyltransferase [Gammaproteobacteria bacterium]
MAEAPAILMVAFHYPPIQGSSGVHRTLSFSNALVRRGWRPVVLTVTRPALENWREENENMVPRGVEVVRALAFDATRHLALRGKYLGFTAWPDRWSSWVFAGVTRGLEMIARRRPAVIYTTYPIATAHIIGYALHRLTGIPWIADFRDPMAQDGYPSDPRKWRAYRWIEQRAVRHASRLLFTAPGALEYYRETFGEALEQRALVIENGYDEALFDDALGEVGDDFQRSGPLRFVHAGVLYPEERDPRSFFAAVRQLADEGVVKSGEVVFSLRATGHDALYRPLIDELGLAEIVTLDPPVGYREALVEMSRADGLLLFQSAGCNFQIPAKVYEYFRARRPILGFTDPGGDSAEVLRAGGVEWLAPLDDASAIAGVLREAIERIGADRDRPFGSAEFAAACGRGARAERFLELVEEVAGTAGRRAD